MEICALRARGWSVSAIARHTGRDRKTVARYLADPVRAGEIWVKDSRRYSDPECFLIQPGDALSRTAKSLEDDSFVLRIACTTRSA